MFSELRAILEALRGMHRRARGKEARHTQSTASCPPFQRQLRRSPLTDKADTQHHAVARGLLNSFTIEEDPHHLEEAVLIAMDYAARENAEDSASDARYQQFRFDVDSATSMELQSADMGPLHEMQFGRFRIDHINRDSL